LGQEGHLVRGLIAGFLRSKIVRRRMANSKKGEGDNRLPATKTPWIYASSRFANLSGRRGGSSCRRRSPLPHSTRLIANGRKTVRKCGTVGVRPAPLMPTLQTQCGVHHSRGRPRCHHMQPCPIGGRKILGPREWEYSWTTRHPMQQQNVGRQPRSLRGLQRSDVRRVKQAGRSAGGCLSPLQSSRFAYLRLNRSQLRQEFVNFAGLVLPPRPRSGIVVVRP